ncbi:hypothetical protein CPB84DRAFT_1753689 [Gymnopilus junonius]|uniref:Uncharacterized protein n=1 Tax=Gymnopilus junonius TaxID=109634 RepID=A0A9P5TGI7_GYMJU|nr:hypothetical protein CPB84DRAFT_1753689 [Gymnopilus junonius]
MVYPKGSIPNETGEFTLGPPLFLSCDPSVENPSVQLPLIVPNLPQMDPNEAKVQFMSHIGEQKPNIDQPTIVLHDIGPRDAVAFWSTTATRKQFPDTVPIRRVGEAAMMYDINEKQLLQPSGFVHTKLNYSHPFLVPFNFSIRTLPIIRTKSGEYKLQDDIVRIWRHHERVYPALAYYLDDQSYLRSLAVKPMAMPSHHRYNQPNRNERLVRWRCMTALMRFKEHWGLLAYSAWRFTNWRSRLASVDPAELGVTRQWLVELEGSGLLDNATPRVGTFVNVLDFQNPTVLARAERNKVPLWFYFGRIHFLGKNKADLYKMYKPIKLMNPNPDMDLLISCLADFLQSLDASFEPHGIKFVSNHQVPSTAPSATAAPPSPSSDGDYSPLPSQNFDPVLSVKGHASPPQIAELDSPMSPANVSEELASFPAPHPRSGQTRGQSWADFFSERRLANQALANDTLGTGESTGAKAVRLAREQQVDLLCDLPPTLDDVEIFVWDLCDEPKGYYNRLPTSGRGSLPLKDFTDSFSNEIDLCPMLGDSPAEYQLPRPTSLGSERPPEYPSNAADSTHDVPQTHFGAARQLRRVLLRAPSPFIYPLSKI